MVKVVSYNVHEKLIAVGKKKQEDVKLKVANFTVGFQLTSFINLCKCNLPSSCSEQNN